MALYVMLVMISAFLWAITNHIDKYLVSNKTNGSSSVKSLMVFSTVIAGVILTPFILIIFWKQISFNPIGILCSLGATIMNVIAIYLYLVALEKNDATVVVVMFNLIPVFSYFLGLIFLNQHLTLKQIIASIIIIVASIMISVDFDKKENKTKSKTWLPMLLMSLSSLCYAIYYLFFDISIEHTNYGSTTFWYQAGLFVVGLIFLTIRPMRQDFVNTVKQNGKKFFMLNFANETINLIATVLNNVALTVLPIVLINVFGAIQDGFVFLIGLVGMAIMPKIIHEDTRPRVVIQKIICIIAEIVGITIMFI